MIDPGSLVGAGAVIGIYYGTRTVVKYVKARDARAARLKQEREQQSLDDLMLWNYLWAHPDDGTEFYTWDSEKGWVENKPWEVVEKMLNWFGRSRESRKQVLRDLGMDDPAPSVWSKDYAQAVVDHGVFLVANRLEELDAERHQRKLEETRKSLEANRAKLEQPALKDNEWQPKYTDEYLREKELDRAWRKSGLCRYCGKSRQGFSSVMCKRCYRTPSSMRPPRSQDMPTNVTELPTFSSETLGDVTYTPSEFVNKVRECVVCEAPTNHHLGYCPECRKEGLHRKWVGDSVSRRRAVLQRQAIECKNLEMRRRLIRRLGELGG